MSLLALLSLTPRPGPSRRADGSGGWVAGHRGDGAVDPVPWAVGGQLVHLVRPSTDRARTSEELLLSVARGDREAFAALHDRMARLVYLNVSRILPDVQRSIAVTQEAFAAVRSHADRFDADRGSAQAWVLMLAHRRAVDRMRSESASTDRAGPHDHPRSRLDRVLEALARHPAGTLPDRLCAAAAEMLRVPGVGIAMVADDVHLQTVASTGTGRRGEELQLTLGEGPAYDAYRNGQPVLIEDLDGSDTWPVLGRDAGESSIRAMFSFPLRSGAARFGALTVYRNEPGPLDDEQYGDALAFARVALDLLLTLQAERPAGDLHELFARNGSDPWEVHQATGMVSAQLGISIGDALARLRGHAFSSGRSISEVAADVVAGLIMWERER